MPADSLLHGAKICVLFVRFQYASFGVVFRCVSDPQVLLDRESAWGLGF